MAFHWDPFTLTFFVAGGILLVAALLGSQWFGPGWGVVAAIGAMLAIAGLAMAFERRAP